MSDKTDAAIDRVVAHFEAVRERAGASGGFRSATEAAIAASPRPYAFGMPTARSERSEYLWRNQYASVTSWTDGATAFKRAIQWLSAHRGVVLALENPLCGVKGQCLGLIRKGVNKFLMASPTSSNGYSELSSVVRRLSTKRGRKMAAKAGVSVAALREKLAAWPKPQPNMMLMDAASFENIQSAMERT